MHCYSCGGIYPFPKFLWTHCIERELQPFVVVDETKIAIFRDAFL